MEETPQEVRKHTGGLVNALEAAFWRYIREEEEVPALAILDGSALFLAGVLDDLAAKMGDHAQAQHAVLTYIQDHLGLMVQQARFLRQRQG
jgi:hypothetical protein